MSLLYAVVEFYDVIKTSGIISLSWLIENETQCYWPNKNHTSLAKRHHPPADDWKIFNCRVLGKQSTFDSALRKLKKSEMTSDINNSDKNSKRIRKRKKYSSDSDSNESIISVTPVSRKRAQAPATLFTQENFEELYQPSQPSQQYSREAHAADIRSSEVSQHQIQEFRKEFKASMDKMISEVAALRAEVACLKTEINSGKATAQGTEQPEPSLKLPLKTEGEVLDSEFYLMDQQNKVSLVSYLSKLGGGDLKVRTRRIMNKLMTNTLALSYNWAGTGTKIEKIAFSSLMLKDVVISAAMKYIKIDCESNSIEKVEEQIKIWLKTAKQRLK